MIGEIPADLLGGSGSSEAREVAVGVADQAPGALALRDWAEQLEMRLMAGGGFGSGAGGSSYYYSPPSAGSTATSDFTGWLGGWGNMSAVPPALIMSTAALRCRVVILDHIAKARPYLRDKDTHKEYTGEFADKLNYPMGNEDPGMSLKRWVTVCISAMLEQGDVHVWKSEEKHLTRYARSGKALRRAYIPLPVGTVDPVPGKAFWKVSEWVFSDPTAGSVVHIPPEEMARIEYLWNPRDYHRGIGPMEACRLAIETDYWYAVQSRNRQAKGGLPALLLMNQRAGTQDQELRAFLAEFRRQMADQRGGVAGLGSDWKVERLGMTAVEADEINSRRYQVEEIARAHGIPLIDLGVYESTGFGREGMAILNRMRHTTTIQPLSERFANGATQQLVAEVEPGLEFAFDWSNVQAAQADLGEAITYTERLFAMGIPMEEAARVTSLALEDYTGKALGFLQSGLLTMEEIILRAEQAEEKAKNPPPVPTGLPPEFGGGGGGEATPGEHGGGAGPEHGGGKSPEHGTPRDDGGEGKAKKEGDDEEAQDESEKKAARTRALLEGARLSAAVVLQARELDALEERARAVGMGPAAFDRLIAQATPREVEASLAYQRRLEPYSSKIQRTYETGVNRAFKTANDRLWKLQKKRKKIRLEPGEPEPEGREVYTDSKGRYYFGALDPTLVDPLVENIGLDSVIDDIMDEEGDAFDEGIDSMREEMTGLGWLAPGAVLGAAAIRSLNRRRNAYLTARRALLGEAVERIVQEMRETLAGSLGAGEDIGTASRRLMKDLRPKFTGGDRATVGADGAVLGTEDAPGRGELWGDEEAYTAANTGRSALVQLEGGEIPPDLWWRWLTMEDDRVRPAHEDIHGVAKRVGDEFIAGSNLTYPGDPAADPALTMNCRCWTTLLTQAETEAQLERAA